MTTAESARPPGRRPVVRASLARFARDACGVSRTEYAIVLIILAVGIAVAAGMMRDVLSVSLPG